MLVPLLVAAASPMRAPTRAAPGALVIIVNDGVPTRALAVEDARRIFLARERFWRDGRRIVPVNLPAGTEIREAFSRRVLGRGSRELVAYWNDLYFHGTLPPQTVASERAMLRFVATMGGAIGYVTAEAELPPGVRVVATVQ